MWPLKVDQQMVCTNRKVCEGTYMARVNNMRKLTVKEMYRTSFSDKEQAIEYGATEGSR